MLTKLSLPVLFLSMLVGCGSDDSRSIALDAPSCVDQAVTMAVTTLASYACEEHFRATLMVTNGSCAPVTVSNIMIAGVVTGSTGNCTPPAAATYPPMVATVGSKQTATVLDLTGGQFCCFQMACPADFTCDESYTFTVNSSAGALTQMADARLNLESCTVICGQ
jgi:hypothetical protein